MSCWYGDAPPCGEPDCRFCTPLDVDIHDLLEMIRSLEHRLIRIEKTMEASPIRDAVIDDAYYWEHG